MHIHSICIYTRILYVYTYIIYLYIYYVYIYVYIYTCINMYNLLVHRILADVVDDANDALSY
jgi:hypothetical protein